MLYIWHFILSILKFLGVQNKIAYPIILIAIFLTVFTAKADSTSKEKFISGKVVSIENRLITPVPFASIQLLNRTDSVFVKGTTTNEDGLFQVAVSRPNEYLLLMSSVGFQSRYVVVKVDEDSRSIDVGELIMQESTILLAEASVVAQRREMTVKNDTIEYDSDAYKLRENAVVEDLLKRLPGITIDEEGKIFVNGKEVKKVMLDGKDFFRSDPNLSIKNIPVDIMDKLQIIEDKSELSKLTGIDDGEENFVINIGVKKDKKKGWLVSNNVGVGREPYDNTDDVMRYSVNSFAARLYQETQLGVVVNGNNINDMTIGGGSNATNAGKPGLNSAFSTGVNFSSGKERKSPWVFNGDLSYGRKQSLVKSNSIRQYYLPDSTSYQTDSSMVIQKIDELRFSGKIETIAIKRWTLSFSPSASIRITNRDVDGYSILQAGNLDRDTVNTNKYGNNALTTTLNARGLFTASYRFAKKGRRLSFNIDSRFSSSQSEGETNARYYYYKRKNNKEVIRDQQWERHSNNFNNRLYMSYIEPLAAKHSLQFVYWIRSENRDNIKNSFKRDEETGEYTVLDLPYSKSVENTTLTQQLSASYRGAINKTNFVVGIDVNPSYIRSRSFIQNGSVNQTDSTITYFPGLQRYNFSPLGYLIHNFGDGKNLRFDYRGRSTSPTVTQLDPSRDESNPNNIRVGNPDLLPKITHWSRLRYNDNNRKTKQSIMVNIEGNYIFNDIINFTDYDSETGIKTTSPINQTGSWNLNGLFMYNRPLSKLFQLNNYTKIGVRDDIGFSNVNSSIGSIKTIATTTSLNQDIGLTFKHNALYIMGKARYDLSRTTYSNEKILDQNISSFGGFISAQLSLPKAWIISTEMNYRYLMGFSSEYNQSELLWNAEISKSIFKNNEGTFSLIINDILRQQLSFTQNISSNFVEDRELNTLKSFIMLAFTYKFNSMGK